MSSTFRKRCKRLVKRAKRKHLPSLAQVVAWRKALQERDAYARLSPNEAQLLRWLEAFETALNHHSL